MSKNLRVLFVAMTYLDDALLTLKEENYLICPVDTRIPIIKKGKVIPLHTTETHGVREGIAPAHS
jgi:hypothetical protein